MIIIGLFGSTLAIGDGFSRVMNVFIGQTNTANNNINNLTGGIRNAETTSTGSINNMRSQVTALANDYRNAGLTQSEAFRRAWNEISNISNTSSNSVRGSWINAFNGIRSNGNNTFTSLTGSINSFSNSMLGTLSKITAGYLSLRGAINLTKEAMKAGSDYQNASTFLQATYGETVGKEKFKWATQEANATPFTESEVASGLARAHSLGLKDDAKSFKMYEDMGSFAKVQGVGDLNSAIDAIVDAQAGSWTRLQTITGIKRAGLEDFAKENNLGKFTNKKGQVTDTEKLMEVLQKYMDEKGISGMTDKFSKTLSGRMSTLKGNWEKTLAEIVGIGEDGAVKDGSLFDNAAKGLEKLINSVNKFSKSEAFDRIYDGLSKIGNGLINGLDYITEHPEVVTTLGKLGAGLVGLKVASGLISPIARVGSLLGGSGLTGVMSGLGVKSIGLAAGLMVLGSALSEGGTLYKGINEFLNGINNNQEGNKKDYVNGFKNTLGAGWAQIRQGAAVLVGNEEWANELEKKKRSYASNIVTKDAEINGLYDTWYGGKDGKTPVKNSDDWKTVRSMISNNEVSSTVNNNTSSNKTEINLNVDTIKETADIDDIMNQIATKINKVNNTRNALV